MYDRNGNGKFEQNSELSIVEKIIKYSFITIVSIFCCVIFLSGLGVCAALDWSKRAPRCVMAGCERVKIEDSEFCDKHDPERIKARAEQERLEKEEQERIAKEEQEERERREKAEQERLEKEREQKHYSSSGSYTGAYTYDPDDYDSPEDFADDAWGYDFDDWDDAYDFWEDW